MPRSLAFFVCFLAMTPAAFSQTANVTLNGTVVDSTHAAVPGATVTATNTQTGLSRSSLSDEAGRYTILSLPAGSYDLQAELAGFKTVLRRNQIFEVGTTISVEFALEVATLSETVELRRSAGMTRL